MTGSVSRKTDYLVAGEAAGSKLAQAERLGVRGPGRVTACGRLHRRLGAARARGRATGARSAVVAGQRDLHGVLDRDGRGQDRCGSSERRRRACGHRARGSSRRRWRRWCSVPVLPRQRPWAIGAAHLVPERPGLSGDGQRVDEGRVSGLLAQQRDDVGRAGAVIARQPRAVVEARVQAKLRATVDRTTAAPAAVVPPAPNRAPRSLSSVSAKKLSDGVLVRCDQRRHRRRGAATARGSEPSAGRRARRGSWSWPERRTPAAFRAADELLRRPRSRAA